MSDNDQKVVFLGAERVTGGPHILSLCFINMMIADSNQANELTVHPCGTLKSSMFINGVMI